MERIFIEATERSPFVDFDFAGGRLRMQGESYPEDAASFFGPILEGLQRRLTATRDEVLVFDLEMLYFNSSSAKALMNMFQMLESAAESGQKIQVNWRYHPDDDTMEEFGEDFSEDFVHAQFRLCPI